MVNDNNQSIELSLEEIKTLVIRVFQIMVVILIILMLLASTITAAKKMVLHHTDCFKCTKVTYSFTGIKKLMVNQTLWLRTKQI